MVILEKNVMIIDQFLLKKTKPLDIFPNISVNLMNILFFLLIQILRISVNS